MLLINVPQNRGGFMSAELHQLSFSGAMLSRGFWLYVWEIVAEDGKTVFYVGMTGDSSSPNAQSPFGVLPQLEMECSAVIISN
jgi:hypothetical protein